MLRMIPAPVTQSLEQRGIPVDRLSAHETGAYTANLSGVVYAVGAEEMLRAYCLDRAKTQLNEFRYARRLYHDSTGREIVLASLVTQRDKVKPLLEEHYGPFNYSPFESAFDEYVIDMVQDRGIKLRPDLVLEHAQAESIDEIKGRGYMNLAAYVNDMVPHEKREEMIIQSGGVSYKKWREAQVDRYTREPRRLMSDMGAVFENIFPDTVWIDPDCFAKLAADLALPKLAALVFAHGADVDTVDPWQLLIIDPA